MAERTHPHTARGALAAACLALACSVAPAREAAPLVADPALEARVLAVAEELRCLVCQNETIAASNAELAVDLRAQIRQQLAQGRSREDILDYMSARYGDFVRYRPPLTAGTVALWAGPFVLLLLGAVALWRQLRGLKRDAAPSNGPALTEAERQRSRALLEGRHL